MGPKAKLRALYAIVQPLAVRIDKQLTEMPEDPPGPKEEPQPYELWSPGRVNFEAISTCLARVVTCCKWDDMAPEEREALESGAAAVIAYNPLVVVREAAAIEARPTPDITPMANAVAATERTSEEERRKGWLDKLDEEINAVVTSSDWPSFADRDRLAFRVITNKLFALAERVIFLERRVLYAVTELP